MSRSKSLSYAKAFALRFIKFRLRSEKEIRDKLKEKGFESALIDETVIFLKNLRFLDDELFAKLWVESRLKRSIGLKRLRYELAKKGIEKGIVEKVIEGLSQDYDEDEAMRQIIELRIKKMCGLNESKVKSRLYGFLLRRGYPQDKVCEVLKTALKLRLEED